MAYKQFKLTLLVMSMALIQDIDSAVIQALIDLDDTSEDLLGSLIRKADNIIDPETKDTKSAANELARALLKIGPTITVTGNITDGHANLFTISFSLNAKAFANDDQSLSSLFSFNSAMASSNCESTVSDYTSEEMDDVLKNHGRGGLFEPLVSLMEPYVIEFLQIAAHSVLGVIISNVMQATALLDNDLIM